jgi:hypothetical protein
VLEHADGGGGKVRGSRTAEQRTSKDNPGRYRTVHRSQRSHDIVVLRAALMKVVLCGVVDESHWTKSIRKPACMHFSFTLGSSALASGYKQNRCCGDARQSAVKPIGVASVPLPGGGPGWEVIERAAGQRCARMFLQTENCFL